MTTKPAPVPRLTPAPDTIGARVRDTAARLNLTETRAAEYFGVPLATYRKWINGTREPAAVVARLLDVLGTLEALAPALHNGLIPAPADPVTAKKRPGRPKVSSSKASNQTMD